MKFYLDVCCLNRPFDNQTQIRIHLEAEAVIAIIGQVENDSWQWVSSDAVTYEISKTPNEERQERLRSMESSATTRMPLTDSILRKAEKFQQLGFTTYDALHLVFAIEANVDVFLSTDDKLLRRARRYSEEISISVANPLSWLQKVTL